MPQSVLRFVLGVALTSIALPPVPAAAAFASVVAPVKPSDDNIRQAEALYKDGKAKFETAEYQEALALWKQAYSMLPDTAETRVIRHALVYNISEAEVQAYEVTRNIAHLRKAKILLQDYLTEHEALHGDGDAAVKERAGARARLKDVSDKLAAAEARGETAQPIDEPPTETAEPGAGDDLTTQDPTQRELTGAQQEKQRIRAERRAAADAKRARAQLIKTDPLLSQQNRRYKRMIIGGSAALGVGTVFGVVTLGAATVAVAPGPRTPGIGAVAIISGGLFAGGIAAGTILLVKGLRGRKQLHRVPTTSALIVPMVTTQVAGLGVLGQF